MEQEKKERLSGVETMAKQILAMGGPLIPITPPTSEALHNIGVPPMKPSEHVRYCYNIIYSLSKLHPKDDHTDLCYGLGALYWHNVKFFIPRNAAHFGYIYVHDMNREGVIKERYKCPVKVGMVIFGNYECELQFVCEKWDYENVYVPYLKGILQP